MADNNTLFFDLGLNTDRLKKDLINAREQIAKMQIKAELDIEIPDISIQGFQKKIEALNKQIADLTNKNKNSNAGWAASEAIKGEIANLNKEVARYQTFIDRLKHAGANVGGIDLSISGGEKVLDIIEKVSAELSKFEKGIDIKLNIGGNGGELEEQISKLNALKSEYEQLQQAKTDRAERTNFLKNEIDRLEALRNKIEEVFKGGYLDGGKYYDKGGNLVDLPWTEISKMESALDRIDKISSTLRAHKDELFYNLNSDNGSSRSGKLASEISELESSIAKMQKAESVTSNLQEELRQLANIDLTVDVNFQEAERKIQELKEEIGELRNIDIVITLANDETAIANLTRLKELVDTLNVPIDIKISGNTDISGMISESSNNSGGLMDKLKQKLDRMADDLFSDPNATGIDYVVNVRANETYLIASVKSILERSKFNVNLEGGDFQKEIEQEVRAALKSLKEKGIQLKTVADADKLVASIKTALRGQEFKIGVVVTKADATRAVKKALEEAASKYSGKEAVAIAKEQALAAKREADARLANAKAMEREAAARLKNAKAAQTESGAINDVGEKLDNISNIISGNLGYLDQFRDIIRDTFSLYGIKRFAEQVITIGGEFEKQKIALKSILGDAIQAEVIYSQIKNLAVKSPFEFKDLTSYAKQLSAFSIPYNELFDTTKRLADISAGLGVDMGRIILAYGQVRSAAVLRGQELRQFTEAGIPLVQELADRFTELEGEVVSTGEVFDRISKRMVSFEMVQDILFDMTEEGGKFFEMQEELAESLSGKWSNLKDAYNIMLSEIAEGNSGVLKGTVELITRMLNNWEKWGAVLGGAATTFAIYKGILAAVNVQQALNIISTQGLTNAQIANNAAYTKGASTLVKSLKGIKTWWAALGSLGHWGLAVAAIAGVGVAVYNLTKKTDAFKKSLEEASNEMSGKLTADMADFKRLVNELGKSIEGTREHSRILNEIKSKYGSFVGDIDNVSNAYEYLRGKVEDVTAAMREQMKQNFITKTTTESTNKFSGVYNDEYESLVNKLQSKDIRRIGDAMSRTDALKVANELFNKAFKLIDEGYSTQSLAFTHAIRDVAEKFDINFGSIKWNSASAIIRNAANALKVNQEEIKEVRAMADAVFGVPDTPDPLKGWRKSVADFISSLEGTDEEIYKVLFPQTPKNDEKTLKDWAQGILNMYDESVKDMELYRKQKETSPELLDEEMMKKEETRLAAFKKIRDKFNLEMFREEKGGGGASDDPVADMWEKRIELLEKAISFYDKWTDIEGRDAALERTKNNDAFVDIFSDANLADILTDPNKVWRYIQGQLGGTSSQRNLALELELKIAGVKEGDLNSYLDKLKDEFEKKKEQWAAYNGLLDVTTPEIASRLIFGSSVTPKSLVGEVRSQIENAMVGTNYSIGELLGIDDKTLEEISPILAALIKQLKELLQLSTTDGEKAISAILEKNLSLEEKLANVERTRLKNIKTIEDNRKKLGNQKADELIDVENKLAAQQVDSIKWDNFKQSEDYIILFDRLEYLSKETLTNLKNKLNELKGALGNLSPTEMKEVMNLIEKITSEEIKDDPFKSFSDSITSFKKAIEGGNDADISISLKNVSDSFEGIVGWVRNATKASEALFDVLGIGFNESAEAALDFVEKAGSGVLMMVEGWSTKNYLTFAQGALTTAGAMAEIFSKIFGNNNDKEEERKFMLDLISLQTRYNAALLETKLLQENIWGKDSLKYAIDAINGLSDAYENYNSIVNKEVEKHKDPTGGFLKNFGKANYWNSLGWWSMGADAATSSSNAEMTTVRNNLRYKIREGNMWRHSRTTDLTQWLRDNGFGELFDENGRINLDLAEQIKDWDKLTGETKEWLNVLIEAEKATRDAEAALRDYLSETFGTLGDSLTDSIVNAFKNGTDAAVEFKKSVISVLEEVAAQIVRNVFLADVLKQYQLTLEDVYKNYATHGDENKFSKDVISATEQFMKDAETADTAASIFLEAFQKIGKEHGFGDLLMGDGASSSLSSGIKGITEDTANLLASYMNAMRQDLSVQRAAIVRFVDELFPKVNILGQAQLQQLNMIQQNTRRNADAADAILTEFRAVLNGTKKVSVK